MPLFEWKPENTVRVERFDKEHQKLFSLVNELNDAMAEGHGKALVPRILRELADYVRWHFSGEEAAMQRAGFVGFEKHVAEHRAITARVEQYCNEVYADPAYIPVDLLFFLRDWLLKHLLTTDLDYGDAMNKAGIH